VLLAAVLSLLALRPSAADYSAFTGQLYPGANYADFLLGGLTFNGSANALLCSNPQAGVERL